MFKYFRKKADANEKRLLNETSQLRNELGSSQALLERTKNDVQKLKSTIKTLVEERDRLRLKSIRIGEELGASETLLEQTKNEVRRLNFVVSGLEDQINQLKPGGPMGGATKILENLLQDHNQKINALNTEIHNLKEKNKRLRINLKFKSDNESSLRRTNESFQREINEALKGLGSNPDDKHRLKSTIKTLVEERERFRLKSIRTGEELERIDHLQTQNIELKEGAEEVKGRFNERLLKETIRLRKDAMSKIVMLVREYHKLNIQSLKAELKTLRKSKAAFLKDVTVNGYHLSEINRQNQIIATLEEKYETLIFHFGNAGFPEINKTDDMENLFGMSAHKEAMRFAYLVERSSKRNT